MLCQTNQGNGSLNEIVGKSHFCEMIMGKKVCRGKRDWTGDWEEVSQNKVQRGDKSEYKKVFGDQL